MKRAELQALLDGWLEPAKFSDVAENGLQIEGRDEIARVVLGVSANRALLEAAVARGADAVVVHHGLVWGGIRRLDGWLLQRVRVVVNADVNLFAYHLPLDAHPTLGNNAGLARALELSDVRAFGRYKGQLIGAAGVLPPSTTLRALRERVAERIGVPVAVFGDPERVVSTIGLCSGGAPDLLHDAVTQRLDVYLTGEVTEWVKAVCDESGTSFIAAGHHATERFGVRALAEALTRAGLQAEFVDVENPA